jgi:rhodanese-related sulfurtransferase
MINLMTKADHLISVKIQEALNKMLKNTVPVISADTLAERLLSTSNWALLDTREIDEFEISHLPGAKWIGHKDFSASRVADVDKERQIIVYCSIGVRSEQIAEKLISLGFTHVWNLYGGIFNWANQGRILVDHKQLNTRFVHGYDKNWAKLVDNPYYQL